MKTNLFCRLIIRFMSEMVRTRRAMMLHQERLYNDLAREFQRAVSEGRTLAVALIEKNAQIEALQQEVLLDPLTGLFRRNAVARLVHPQLHTWQRHQQGGGNCPPMSVAMIDVDFFKRVNDTLGHAAGDIVLRRVAHWIRQIFRRDTDFAIRFGGEEFLVVSMNLTPMEAARLAEDLRRRIESDPELTISPGQVTVSVGVSAIRIENKQDISASLTQACERADQALYRIKASGRNSVALN